MGSTPPLLHRPTAPLWRRIVARAIDLATVLTVLFTAIVIQLFWFIGELSDRWQPEPWGRRLTSTLAFIALSAVYEWAFLVHSNGQTPGKDIMKLRVVTGRPTGAIPTGPALLRWLPLGLTPLLPSLPMMIVAAGLVSAPAFWASRRTGSDLLAGTRVVHYDRDLEDAAAKRPKARWRRRHEARESETLEAIPGRFR